MGTSTSLAEILIIEYHKTRKFNVSSFEFPRKRKFTRVISDSWILIRTLEESSFSKNVDRILKCITTYSTGSLTVFTTLYSRSTCDVPTGVVLPPLALLLAHAAMNDQLDSVAADNVAYLPTGRTTMVRVVGR